MRLLLADALYSQDMHAFLIGGVMRKHVDTCQNVLLQKNMKHTSSTVANRVNPIFFPKLVNANYKKDYLDDIYVYAE